MTNRNKLEHRWGRFRRILLQMCVRDSRHNQNDVYEVSVLDLNVARRAFISQLTELEAEHKAELKEAISVSYQRGLEVGENPLGGSSSIRDFSYNMLLNKYNLDEKDGSEEKPKKE